MKAFFVLALSLFSLCAHAEVYQCKINGKTQFSQHPCAEIADQTTLDIKAKSVKHDMVVVTSRPTVDQMVPFVFDDFKWRITNVYTFKVIGSRKYPKYPKDEAFIIVEMEIQNLAKSARFVHNSMVLLTEGKQFEATISGYAEDVMGYPHGNYVQIEPGITKKIYKIFDGTQTFKYELIIREITGDDSVGVNIAHVDSK